MGDEIVMLRKMLALDHWYFSRALRRETGDQSITANDVVAWENGKDVPPPVVKAIEVIDKNFRAHMGL